MFELYIPDNIFNSRNVRKKDWMIEMHDYFSMVEMQDVHFKGWRCKILSNGG